jgi:hypothetical protein
VEYWSIVLRKHLGPLSGKTLLVPTNVAISIRKHGPDPGTTFDEASAIQVFEDRIEASGSHGGRPTRTRATWEEVQSITFSYKAPR